jgi:hypothetical protein
VLFFFQDGDFLLHSGNRNRHEGLRAAKYITASTAVPTGTPMTVNNSFKS